MRLPLRRSISAPVLVALLVGLLATGCGSQQPPAQRQTPTITPPAALVGQYHHYVGLGDSYTSAPYVPVTEPTDPCLRSSRNYPSLIAESLAISDFSDHSCGGARSKNMTVSQLPGVPPQLDALDSKTDLVTIGIGGNDSKIAETLMGSCPTLAKWDPTGSPCRTAIEQHGTDLLFDAIPIVAERVSTVLAAIHQHSPRAQVVVVGYPRLAPSHGTCPQLPLAAGDYRYANQVISRLDRALARVTDQAGDIWVDLWKPSRGHDICSASPWLNGSVTDTTRAAAYHPFESEQQAVARLVEQALVDAQG